MIFTGFDHVFKSENDLHENFAYKYINKGNIDCTVSYHNQRKKYLTENFGSPFLESNINEYYKCKYI